MAIHVKKTNILLFQPHKKLQTAAEVREAVRTSLRGEIRAQSHISRRLVRVAADRRPQRAVQGGVRVDRQSRGEREEQWSGVAGDASTRQKLRHELAALDARASHAHTRQV